MSTGVGTDGNYIRGKLSPMALNPFAKSGSPHLLAIGMIGAKMGERFVQIGCAHGGRLGAVAAKVGLSGRLWARSISAILASDAAICGSIVPVNAPSKNARRAYATVFNSSSVTQQAWKPSGTRCGS